MSKKVSLNYFCPVNGGGFSNFSEEGFYSVNEISKADFVVISGGEDISSHLYGEEPKGTRGVNEDRDALEIYTIGLARIFGIPVFGLCRGAQLIHVLNGGKLHQHLPSHFAGTHDMVSLATGEVVAEVNSLHHQGIPIEEAASMYGTDNVYVNDDRVSVEAFADKKRKTFGVQYHPEYYGCPKRGFTFFANMVRGNVSKEV